MGAQPGLKYTVRESARARHVRLLISVRDGSLTVVIPRGFERQRIPEVVKERRAWIERAQRRIIEQRRRSGAEADDRLPRLINLRAVGEEWQVEYRDQRRPDDSGRGHGRRTLVLYGAIDNEAGCKQALRRWVHAQARRHLSPRLLDLSRRHRLPVKRVTIRRQRTRWGSCSERDSINLNAKLMFLPPHLVAQVMAHELCHAVHHDHSGEFWALVERVSPGCRELESELRTAWRYVPAWFGE